MTPDTLGEVTSSRNARLAGLLVDVPLPDRARVVCENRGSGIPIMVELLRRAGMALPDFEASLSRFRVTLPKASLLDAPTVIWLTGLGLPDLTDTQRMGLALMRSGRGIDNSTLRQLGLDSRDATTALADLVSRGLAVKSPGRRYASYELAPGVAGARQGSLFDDDPTPSDDGRRGRAQRLEQVLELMESGREYHVVEIARAMDLGRAVVSRYLTDLIARGQVTATAPPRHHDRRYRRTMKATGTTREST